MNRWWLLACLLAALLAAGCDEGTTASWSVDGSSAQADDDTADDDTTDDDAVDDDECALVAPAAYTMPDLSAGPSVVSFDDQLVFTVNGQRFYPLGFYNVPNDEAGLAAFKAEGFNIALTGPGCCSGSSLQDQIDLLERAVDAEVMIIMHPWSSMESLLTRPDEELAAELDARNDVGSLFGWYTFDEPGLYGTPLEVTHRAHQVLSDYDPNHLDGLVEQAMIPFTYYMDDCAMFMIDPYPVGWMPLSFVKAMIQDAQEAAAGTKPIVGVMQAFSWDWIYGDTDVPFHPDAVEMRNMTWQYIVLGVSGIVAWNYGGDYAIRAQDEIWSAFLGDIAEINELMSVILGDNADLDLQADATFPETFDYVVKQDETATWILSVSTNTHSMDVTFDLSSLGTDLCIVDYSTGETFTQDDDGKIEVEYDGYQVRVLEIR